MIAFEKHRFRLCLAKNRFENTKKRIFKRVVKIMLLENLNLVQRFVDLTLTSVDWNRIVEHIEGIFCLFISRRVLWLFDEHVGHSIAELRCRAWVSLSHSFGEFAMCLLRCVSLGSLRQFFRDDELGDVDSVEKKISDRVFRVLDGSFWVPVDQHHVQAFGDELGSESAIITTDSFDTLIFSFPKLSSKPYLAIHLIMFLRIGGIVEPSVSFFVDKKIRTVDFFKLQFDRLDECSCDKFCCFGTELK